MYFIGALELLAFGLVVVSIVKREFIKMNFLWFRWALALSAFCFAILGFGLRVIRDFQGSANLFFYMGVILVAYLLLEKFEIRFQDRNERQS
jgi:polysaccharide pyruvyl transferase WcaK-like protein